MSAVGDAAQSLIANHNNSVTQVSVKAVGSQLALMTGISVATIVAFSFFRPREKKVYQPKIKYQLPAPENPLDDPDYEPPPPKISNGFFAWLSPVLHLREEQMIANIGLDATAFLRFLRLMRNAFSCISLGGIALLVMYVIYNLRAVDQSNRNALSLLTIQNVQGGWMWPSLGMSYLFNFVTMYFIWRNWGAMVLLRERWFRSPAYQTKIYSRTLMVQHIRKDYRSDEGLVALMGMLKVDGIKIGPEIDCTTIGRRMGDFPKLVEEHNESVEHLEEHLVKYLKNGQMASKRPTLRKGGFLGIFGGEKKDAIDYLAKEIKFLRDKIDAQRQAINSLLRQERKARKGGKPAAQRIEGENYGFVTFKTISEAHRIARAHRGKLKELGGAELSLAPMPADIVWENIDRDDAVVRSRRTFGFAIIGVICFFYTLPLLVVSILANLSQLTVWVPFLEHWKDAGQWGNWTFSIVAGVLPSAISALFGYFLPIIIRKVSKYQGAPTRSRLDRAVTARYFFFLIIANVAIFSLLSVFYGAITEVVLQIGQHQSAKAIFEGMKDIPYQIQGTYVQQSTYWLTWLPLRGFLVIFELIQLIKLAMVSIRRFVFSHTPRTIREMTKPGYFEYAVIISNLLYVAAVGMIYAPLAPLVAIGATLVFWFSSVVYKYQLLYVYISRAESGGRMWNVYVNRLIACLVLMSLLMVLTTGLVRRRWLDAIAAVPPLLILLGFKVYLHRTFEQQFKYYNPTPAEAEAERQHAFSEKRTHHSEMEKRFLHPALQHDKLFQVMVHKQQEALARDVLSAYPWFVDKHDRSGEGVQIKAVREENLEYDPNRDGPRDAEHQQEWDARSHNSTDMLTNYTKTEPNTPWEGPQGYGDPYSHLPLPTTDSPNASTANLPGDYPSTDNLLTHAGRNGGGQDYRPRKQPSRPYPTSRDRDDPVASSPLLYDQPQQGYQQPQNVPYPPNAYAQPTPPVGYTPPTMRRTGTNDSEGYGTRWDSGDIGAGAAAGAAMQGRMASPPSYRSSPPTVAGGQGQGRFSPQGPRQQQGQGQQGQQGPHGAGGGGYGAYNDPYAAQQRRPSGGW